MDSYPSIRAQHWWLTTKTLQGDDTNYPIPKGPSFLNFLPRIKNREKKEKKKVEKSVEQGQKEKKRRKRRKRKRLGKRQGLEKSRIKARNAKASLLGLCIHSTLLAGPDNSWLSGRLEDEHSIPGWMNLWHWAAGGVPCDKHREIQVSVL